MELMAEVVGPALAHAGLGAQDVDGIFVGNFNNGFQKQDFQGALVAMGTPGLEHVPAVRMENACATGSAALYSAMDFIAAGRGRVALVVGVEKMTAIPTASTTNVSVNGIVALPESARRLFSAGPCARGGIVGVIMPVRPCERNPEGARSRPTASPALCARPRRRAAVPSRRSAAVIR